MGAPFWPEAWKRASLRKPKCRNLAFAAHGQLQAEHLPELIDCQTADQVRAALFAHSLLVYMHPDDFKRLLPDFLDRHECVWSDSAERIIAFRVRSGRQVRWVYRATVWAGLLALVEQQGSAAALARLRAFLDHCGVGDQGTPAAVGAWLMADLFPRGKSMRRPPWPAWQDLFDNLIAGRTELLTPWSGPAATEIDINNAYAAALAAGVPSGWCWRCYVEEDFEDAAWWYGHWKWELPTDAGVEYGCLGVRPHGAHGRADARLRWPVEPGATGEGWYTGAEIQAARDAGYRCEFLGRGWAWDELSTDFAEWARWMDAAKRACKDRGETLEAQWIKQATVGAIGRLGMNRFETEVWGEDCGEREARSPVLCEEEYAVMLEEKHALHSRADLLIHVCVQVHAHVRQQLREAYVTLRQQGLQPVMSNIDCWYVPGHHRASGLPMGVLLGEWKQKMLLPLDFGPDVGTIQIPKAGWVRAGNLIKTPGVPHESNL